MSPELIKAVKERISAKQDLSTIKAELTAAGYTESQFEAVFSVALAEYQKEHASDRRTNTIIIVVLVIVGGGILIAVGPFLLIFFYALYMVTFGG